MLHYTHDQLITFAKFETCEISRILQCRRSHNKLGFGYQFAFLKLANRFPDYPPFEIVADILAYVGMQLSIFPDNINEYSKRFQTIYEHQEQIRTYLGFRRLNDEDMPELRQFIFDDACRLEQSSALMTRTTEYLKEKKILIPSEDTLRRIIGFQKEDAKKYIYDRITKQLDDQTRANLDVLLDTGDKRQSEFYLLKQPPLKPSPQSVNRLTEKLDKINLAGILQIDLSWLNNNFQRSLTHKAKNLTATRIRNMIPAHRYSIMTCFLQQLYRETVDYLVDMFDKLVNRIYSSAQKDIDVYNKISNRQVKKSLATYQLLIDLVLDDSIKDSLLRRALFKHISKEELSSQMIDVKTWLSGKHSHVFNLVKDRFSYIRQFSPNLLRHIQLEIDGGIKTSLLDAVNLLKDMNENNQRRLPDDAPTDFIPEKIVPMVQSNGKIDKRAWESALLTAVRDEIKSGNLSVKLSKRFSKFDDYFIPYEKWEIMRESFFKKAGLPVDPNEAAIYLTERLNAAFVNFLETLPVNSYARIDEKGWKLSVDPAEKLDTGEDKKLYQLNEWLSNNMRVVKLPDLLIEVDNEIKFSRFFMPTAKQASPGVDDISAVLITIMAHGCNIGPYTMSHMTQDISYNRIKHITDWMLTEESQRSALAIVVNAISHLDITKVWGEGRTSSSDGQRFSFRSNVLQQTFSTKFNALALEFYSYVADNFAPFYSMPIECTDRDAPFVMDGLLYNESELPLYEHFTDTHGYTENNFAGFAMLGRKFSPRIRGLHKQWIYKIDENRDYRELTPLVCRKDHTIHMNWIIDQWDRMGQFYASLETGHVTASTAMKRLNSFTGKNHFYRANRELGRIFKTEHILEWMSDKTKRQLTRRGLLKGEQIHNLARDLNFGKRGRLTSRDIEEQKNSCSCLTIILASIIYWQIKEINRVINEYKPGEAGIDLALLEHVSPIAWNNVILYGDIIINKKLIKP